MHPWFVESASSRTSAKRDWYVWVPVAEDNGTTAAGPPGPPPNNWRSFFGGSAWQFDTNTRAWYLHQYLPSQPDLNWRNREVQAAFADIIRFWQHRGVDGFRIDSLPTLLEHEQLADEPPNPEWREGMDPHDALIHLNYTQDVWPIHRLVRGLRAVADDGRSVLVCETRVRLHELARCVPTQGGLACCQAAAECCVAFPAQLLRPAPARVPGARARACLRDAAPALTRRMSTPASSAAVQL